MTNKSGEKDKIIGVCLQSWDSNEPRFVVKKAHEQVAEERAFKNGKCVFNQRLGFAYSVEEIVNALNILGELEDENKELKKEREELEKEDKRLCNVISNLHDDIRRYDRKIKKQQMLINIQWDIIASLMELKGVIDDE